LCYLSLESAGSFALRGYYNEKWNHRGGAADAAVGCRSGQTPAAPSTHLKVGDKAPEFELGDTTGNKVKLADFRGKKNVVLAFYVLAFTGG